MYCKYFGHFFFGSDDFQGCLKSIYNDHTYTAHIWQAYANKPGKSFMLYNCRNTTIKTFSS